MLCSEILPQHPAILPLPPPGNPRRGGPHPRDLCPVLRLPGPIQALCKAANYLYVIAGNLCRDHYRRQSELPLADLPEPADRPLDTLDTRLDLQDAFRVLPPEIQPAAVLFFLQERKQREIAKILGIGLPLVKYRIRKARELLAQFLRKEAP